MKITIFGATGRTGHLLVQQALDAGHQVSAYARTPAKLQITHPRLTTIEGQLDDDHAILAAVRGADAVIEGVGSVSDATQTISTAMSKAGVKRLVVVSTCSAPDPDDLPDPDFEALIEFVKTRAPQAYAEVRRAAEIVRASDLDWTLVRVAKLDDETATGHLKVGHYGHHVVGLSTTRADLAAFLLAQTSDDTYLRQAPAISN
ncbi:NAD(P)-dependent oxidoreductase [Nonomuraea sp. NPDC002799]